MPYQLPPELRTSKFSSLPDDLREIAEAALAEKFDLPEIVVKKKKKTPPKKREEPQRADERMRGYYQEMVTIIVKTDRMMAMPISPIVLGSSSAKATIDMERYPYFKQQAVSIPPHIYGQEVAELIERTLCQMLEQMRYEGMRLGSRDAIILGYEGQSREINSHRDIEEFVLRNRIGDQRGRY